MTWQDSAANEEKIHSKIILWEFETFCLVLSVPFGELWNLVLPIFYVTSCLSFAQETYCQVSNNLLKRLPNFLNCFYFEEHIQDSFICNGFFLLLMFKLKALRKMPVAWRRKKAKMLIFSITNVWPGDKFWSLIITLLQ